MFAKSGCFNYTLVSVFTKNARMGLAVKTCDKMAADKKTRLFKAANAFITKVSQ